jgi:hypothetical protein
MGRPARAGAVHHPRLKPARPRCLDLRRKRYSCTGLSCASRGNRDGGLIPGFLLLVKAVARRRRLVRKNGR